MSTHSRTNPYLSKIRERYLLTKEGSSKETFHISLDIDGSALPFQVGDSIAVYAENDRIIVDEIVQILGGDVEVLDRTKSPQPLSLFLLKKANISKCTSSVLRLLGEETLLIPENKELLTEFLQVHQLIDLLRLYSGKNVSAQAICSALLPMMPRFYSVASSPKMFPHEIHLTVASLTYDTVGGPRHGVGSYFLGHTAEVLSTIVPIYVQPSNGFTLPSNHSAPIILIGPGTGVAPFRAFLQERMALQHPGKNWLFFGERNKATDFYYADYFLELEKLGHLRLDTAFSRDKEEKVYVQHLLWEKRAEVWKWIEQGAFIYVCGDAEKMAKDVDITLHNIAKEMASLTEEGARDWLKNLRKDRRYIQDVY